MRASITLTVLTLVGGLSAGCGTSGRVSERTASVVAPEPGSHYDQMLTVSRTYPSFAGFYNDGEGKLNINTTDPNIDRAVVDLILSTFANTELSDNVERGVVFNTVKYSYGQLFSYWYDNLNNALYGRTFRGSIAISSQLNKLSVGFMAEMSDSAIDQLLRDSEIPADALDVKRGMNFVID